MRSWKPSLCPLSGRGLAPPTRWGRPCAGVSGDFSCGQQPSRSSSAPACAPRVPRGGGGCLCLSFPVQELACPRGGHDLPAPSGCGACRSAGSQGGWAATGEGSSGAEIRGGAAGQSWVSSSLCRRVSVAARREPVWVTGAAPGGRGGLSAPGGLSPPPPWGPARQLRVLTWEKSQERSWERSDQNQHRRD